MSIELPSWVNDANAHYRRARARFEEIFEVPELRLSRPAKDPLEEIVQRYSEEAPGAENTELYIRRPRRLSDTERG